MFKKGDKVRSRYYSTESWIIRTVTHCYQDGTTASGYRVSTDGGIICHNCGMIGKPINGVDSAWFEKVEND